MGLKTTLGKLKNVDPVPHFPAAFHCGDASHLQTLVCGRTCMYVYICIVCLNLYLFIYFTTQDPFTHIYMFDTGFPQGLLNDIGRAFLASSTAQYLVCYKSSKVIRKYFSVKLKLSASFQVTMTGSTEKKKVFFYKRDDCESRQAAQCTVEINGQVFPADPMFVDVCTLAQSTPVVLYNTVRTQCAEHIVPILEDTTLSGDEDEGEVFSVAQQKFTVNASIMYDSCGFNFNQTIRAMCPVSGDTNLAAGDVSSDCSSAFKRMGEAVLEICQLEKNFVALSTDVLLVQIAFAKLEPNMERKQAFQLIKDLGTNSQ